MAHITTAKARSKLQPRGKPYFRSIDRKLDLGFRKNATGGTWVVRVQKGSRTKLGDGKWSDAQYSSVTIGAADDHRKADGVEVLNYDQAEAKARRFARGAEERALVGPSITVKGAIAEYLSTRDKQERASKGGLGLKHDAASRLTRHVLSETLAAKKLDDLSEGDLGDWRSTLVSKAAMSRNGETLAESTIRRTVNDLKAALNAAHKRHRARLPASLAIVIKNGLAIEQAMPTPARKAQVLPDADVRAIVEAARRVDHDGNWGGDLARLVLVLAATGARFSQAARLTVADVRPAHRQIMMPTSRKGRGTKAVAHTRISIGEDVLAALRPVLVGRTGSEPLLLRPRWRQVGPVKWEVVGRAPWLSASELLRPWAMIIKRAGLADDLVPYALRHSSIVRGLAAGLPVRLVAALHDTSSEMIERHYAHFIVDAMDELAARAVVPLVTPAPAPLHAVG